MSLLLDTNICSAHLKRPAGLMHRFVQYSGRLYISTVALCELFAWAYHRKSPSALLEKLEYDLLADVKVLEYDKACAEEFGRLHGQFLQQGRAVSRLDLMIAATAIAHDLTLITHNIRDFAHIANLRLDDWIED